MTSFVRELIAFALVRKDDCARHGIKAQRVVVLGQDGLDAFSKGAEVGLINDGLYKLNIRASATYLGPSYER